MNISIIFKQVVDSQGYISKIEIVETDLSDRNAAKFARLFQLQTPADLKKSVDYSYVTVRVQ